MLIYTTAEYPLPAVKKLDVIGIQIDTAEIRVHLKWYTDANVFVKSGSLTISGSDYTAIMQTAIPAGAVGVAFGVFLKRGVLNKVKTMLGITGTVE